MAQRKAKSPPGKLRTNEPSTLYTLSALSKKTGISMPTLQKYKRFYQRRIPSVGQGRKQRYPEEALAVVAAIKQENLKKRGRRKRPARKATRKQTARKLLPLLEISRRTGISYPTLVRYVKLHGKKIPSTGSGRKRRYPPEAIAVFKKIRSQSKRGPKPAKRAAKAARPRARNVTVADEELAARIRALENSQQRLAKQLDTLIAELRKPILVTFGG